MKKSKSLISLRKGLAVAIIFLFIGVAVAPSINANISKASVESELVEITTEVFGSAGIKPHTVKLSREKAEVVKLLMDNAKSRLDKAETIRETIIILNETIVELEKHGLLPDGMSIEEVEKLITCRTRNIRLMEMSEGTNNFNSCIFDNQSNYCCLVAGTASETCFGGGPITWLFLIRHIPFLFLLLIEKWFRDHAFWIFVKILNEFIDSYSALVILRWFVLIIHSQLNPLPIANKIGLGARGWIPREGLYSKPANGWLFTIGLNGIKRWSGSFWGDLPIKRMNMYDLFLEYYPGVLGFTGIRIINPLSGEDHYLGSALWVKIEYD